MTGLVIFQPEEREGVHEKTSGSAAHEERPPLLAMKLGSVRYGAAAPGKPAFSGPAAVAKPFFASHTTGNTNLGISQT
jgi:hypothetical protein